MTWAAPRWDIDEESVARFMRALDEPPSSPDWFRLRRATEHLAITPGFDRLITLDCNTIKELPHQIQVARQVLNPPMSGRAILADEVGLGKTIEAGIILKELAIRGHADRVLILTPASLVEQWRSELATKFFEEFDTPESPGDWHEMPLAVASLSKARGKRHSTEILRHRWDLLIVDEAHKVKNHKSKTYQFLQEIERNFILLLTATPLQNNLRELYNLVTLLRPGHLGTWRDFQQQYVVRGNPRRARDPERLREIASEVMVRTRRSSVAHMVNLPPRRPKHPLIVLTPAEARLYQETERFLKDLYRHGFHQGRDDPDNRRRKKRTGKGIFFLELLRLCQRLCSSSKALSASLLKLSDGELVLPEFRVVARRMAHEASEVSTHAKLDALTRIIQESPDRLIVFTEHVPTLRMIARHVKDLGRRAITFSGRVPRTERVRRLARFRADDGAIFVATRAGTEGLNLQFCNRMVNYELPWNPMVVEQRIGRIHRIGQEREAFIYNFAAQGSVESRVLELLDQKIRLFELVVGELDVILGDFGGAETLESRLGEAWLGAESTDAFDREIAEIGEELEISREAGKEQESVAGDVVVSAGDRLTREFPALSRSGRLRIGYSTEHVIRAPGFEVRRHRLGVHEGEIIEVLDAAPEEGDGGRHPDYGQLTRLTGVTGRGRAIVVVAQLDALPMTLVDVEADEAAPLSGSAA